MTDKHANFARFVIDGGEEGYHALERSVTMLFLQQCHLQHMHTTLHNATRAGLFKARLSSPRISEDFCSFLARCSAYIFRPSVLSLNNLKLHKT